MYDEKRGTNPQEPGQGDWDKGSQPPKKQGGQQPPQPQKKGDEGDRDMDEDRDVDVGGK